jgi:hypothetical protein
MVARSKNKGVGICARIFQSNYGTHSMTWGLLMELADSVPTTNAAQRTRVVALAEADAAIAVMGAATPA